MLRWSTPDPLEASRKTRSVHYVSALSCVRCSVLNVAWPRSRPTVTPTVCLWRYLIDCVWCYGIFSLVLCYLLCCPISDVALSLALSFLLFCLISVVCVFRSKGFPTTPAPPGRRWFHCCSLAVGGICHLWEFTPLCSCDIPRISCAIGCPSICCVPPYVSSRVSISVSPTTSQQKIKEDGIV